MISHTARRVIGTVEVESDQVGKPPTLAGLISALEELEADGSLPESVQVESVHIHVKHTPQEQPGMRWVTAITYAADEALPA